MNEQDREGSKAEVKPVTSRSGKDTWVLGFGLGLFYGLMSGNIALGIVIGSVLSILLVGVDKVRSKSTPTDKSK